MKKEATEIKKRNQTELINGIMKDRHLLKELTFEITKKCPMECILCSSNGGTACARELTINEIKNIIDDSIQLGTKHINLSGGEPLIHPRIIAICSYIKDKGLTVDVYTCGNIETQDGQIVPIGEDLLQALRRISIDKLIFSIHGDSAEIHDKMTTGKGSFNNLMESIKRAAKIGLFTELHFVATKLNYKSLPNIMNLVRSFKINRLSVLRFVPQGRGIENKSLLELNSEDILELRDILYQLRKEHSPLMFRTGAPFNCFQLGNPTFCTAGVAKATIKADASVFPCVSMKDFVSKDNDNSLWTRCLSDIWKDSSLFTDTRIALDKIEKESYCKNCVYFSNCRGGCLTQRLINKLEEKDPYCMKHESFIIIENKIKEPALNLVK